MGDVQCLRSSREHAGQAGQHSNTWGRERLMSSAVMSAQMWLTSAFKAANPRCRETAGGLEFGQDDVTGRVERGILATGKRIQCR